MSDMTTYSPGAIVHLLSGGPPMTVATRPTNAHPEYRCQWFDGHRLQEGRFPGETLARAGQAECSQPWAPTTTMLRALAGAQVYAAERHCAQRRKDAQASPYINHPLQLVEVLVSVGGISDATVLCAATLHDVIEETGTPKEEIASRFGAAVADMVDEVSDDKSLPKAERKRLQVEHAPLLSHGAKLIKLADKICNVRDMLNSPPHDWSEQRRAEYIAWAAEVVERLRGTHAGLEKAFDELLARQGKPATQATPGR